MDLIEAFATLVRVVELGSFSAVARERGATQSAVSRQITALEGELGVRLIQRTTRHLALTEDGRETLDHARAVLDAVAATRNAAARRSGEVAGTVRLATPVLVGHLIATRMNILLERHPGISLELVMARAEHDMIEEGLDLWLRLGESTHASEVTRTLGQIQRVAVAAPEYLAARGRPTHPDELAGHDCLTQPQPGPHRVWRFHGAAGAVAVTVSGRFSTDNGESTLRAALAGIGIVLTAEVVTRADLAAGRLIAVLPGWEPEPVPVTLVYPSRRNLPPRVRAVISFITADILPRPEALANSGPSG